MNTKIWLVIVLLIIAAAAVYFSSSQKSPALKGDDEKKNDSVENNPKFISGEAAEVSADRIALLTRVFSTNAQGVGRLDTAEKIIKINNQTAGTRQVNTKGVISITPALFADIKAGSRLTVYYSVSSGDELTAE